MSGSVFLDSNILVYAYDKHDPKKQAKAQAILRLSSSEIPKSGAKAANTDCEQLKLLLKYRVAFSDLFMITEVLKYSNKIP